MSDFRPGWCIEHADLAKMYDDGSWGCWWELVCETSVHSEKDAESFASLSVIAADPKEET